MITATAFLPLEKQCNKLTQMKNIPILLFFLFLFSEVEAAKVPFIDGGIYMAKETAGREGKLFFVDFYASWCAPCQIMDETTFKDPAVIAYVKKFYVPVKVDIDDFDGIAYKQQYNIKVLPTTLVFNSKGELLERVEEALSPTKMLKLLKKHNKFYNRDVVIKTPKKAPKKTYTPPVRHTKPAAPAQPKAKPKKKKTTSAGSGLYRFDVKKENAAGYSVQVGVYADYANVLQQTSRMQKKYKGQPMLVHIATLGNKVVYRLMVGSFTNKNSADKFLSKIKNNGGEGVVKTLEELN